MSSPEIFPTTERDAESRTDTTPHIVIVGGGFGGIAAARELAGQPVRVTLIDRRNFHLFQPLLYQVATASLAPSDVAFPIRALFRRQQNVRILLDEVTAIDPGRQVVVTETGEVAYDFLIVAAGAVASWFGHDREWAPLAPGLKSMEDALDLRSRILAAFEQAEREPDPARRSALITFVVVGGGPTGVELAGALAEIAQQTMRWNFRTFDPATARIIMVEGGDVVLGGYPASLSAAARATLEDLGVDVRTSTRVTAIEPGKVTVGDEEIATGVVLWGAGVTGNPLGQTLGVDLASGDRLPVTATLALAEHPNVFVVGDLAAIDDGHGGTLPGVAQVAMQGGRHAARTILRTIAGQPATPFRYRDKGTMATIGWNRAVAEIGPLKLRGFPAWFIWATIHIAFLVDVRSRFSVMWQWMWAYITRNRSARLIVGYEVPTNAVHEGFPETATHDTEDQT